MLSPQFWEKAISPEKLFQYSASLIRVAIVLTLAWIASSIVKRFVRKIHEYTLRAMQANTQDTGESAKRAATLSGLFRRTVTSLIWVVASITALQQAGFDIAPLLATAGVAGLAVSFGAQNLVRDMFSGVFLLIEDQIRVGDVAEINGTGGLVEQINLRTTRLRALDGTVHIFPNGTITKLSNLTQEYSYYVWDLGIGYTDDTDEAIEAVRELARQMQEEPAYAAMILEPLEVLGVDQFAADAVVIKMRIKTRPIQQWAVGRELNRRIKKRFDELGIDIPVPQRTLHLGKGVAQALAEASSHSLDRAALKEIVREVMLEMRAADTATREQASSV
ncbi:MAG: mechanosensitive ion channel family protein [Bryobacterales bacterium]|nr:mechanosensitive ion channel family protein [Bryobacterales bacterium]